MGILDNIKDSAKKYVNDNKDEFTKKAEEFIKDKELTVEETKKLSNLKDKLKEEYEKSNK